MGGRWLDKYILVFLRHVSKCWDATSREIRNQFNLHVFALWGGGGADTGATRKQENKNSTEKLSCESRVSVYCNTK